MSKKRRGKPMGKMVKKRIKAGRWKEVTFRIKPKFRKKLTRMSKKNSKQLYVRQKIRSRKVGRKRMKRAKAVTIFHRYKVRTPEQ
ncbi:MAG: hypothetical protein IPK93_02600 [Solirubrobacterales bacterium]|nr:hypothetical protein [Solirubrobacterales bacterium]